ncbi:hypothetical protein [Nesterenkonia pannonica]|uniref:hypothetical protein n=1 Tax=Nesterenkonia pannonica TaxID=1548602 RepID=UPI002164A1FE|nr:hypothetical protein [Nesterenkonia pannonica]
MGTHGRARELAARAAVEDAEHHAHATGPQAESHARLQVLIESRAIWSLLLGAVIGLLVGFVVFPGSGLRWRETTTCPFSSTELWWAESPQAWPSSSDGR